MSINELVKDALAPTGILVVPDAKQAPDMKYFVINYYTHGDDYGDDSPQHEKYSLQIHLFCPHNFNSISIRKKAKILLFNAGFTFPSIADASDGDGQHWVIECEYVAAVEVDG